MADAKQKFTETIGRRKTASARVRAIPASKTKIVVNGKPLEEYTKLPVLQGVIKSPLTAIEDAQAFDITVVVNGGGIRAQAEAIRHGISRLLVEKNTDVRPTLKKLGYLKRDPRKKERKKPGLLKARKSPQWSKR